MRATQPRSWAAGPRMVDEPGAVPQGESVDICPVPGWADEDTTSTTTDLLPAMVVSSAAAERPVGALPGGTAG